MTHEKTICPICGKEFVKKQKNSKCCSKSCNQKLYRMKNRKIYKKTCSICGCEFETSISTAKYCGKLCAAKASSIRSSAYAKKVQYEPKQCDECGEKFIPRTKASKFCCKDCYKAYYARLQIKPFKEKVCVMCGKKFQPNNSSMKYCCDVCRKEAQKKAHKKYTYNYDRDSGIKKKKTKDAPSLWAKMSLKEISAECARFHLTYGQAQVMAQNGTLPKDFGKAYNAEVGTSN